MSIKEKREFLSAQLGTTQKLLKLVEEDPIMTLNLQHTIEEFQAEMAKLPEGGKEAKATLYFSGDPVLGSKGIDVRFVSDVLQPFQNMVMTDYANRWHGKVGGRGRRVGESESQLLLSALPRGSFGLELIQGDRDDLFSENYLAETLTHVTKLVAASEDDQKFDEELRVVDSRVIRSLSQFLKVISQGKAGVKLESGDFRSEMGPDAVKAAYRRVSNSVKDDEEIEVAGVFQGVLLADWTFNFLRDSNQSIKGDLDDSLTREEAVSFGQFLDKRCTATMRKMTVTFRTGEPRTTFTLMAINSSPSELNLT